MRLSEGRRCMWGYDAIKLVAACCTFILIDVYLGGLPMNMDKKINLKFKKQKSNSIEDSSTYQVEGIVLKLMKTENAF